MHRRTTILAALPQPRHATSAVAGVVASHRALNRAILPIEGARTHAPAISTGALAVFRAFQHASPPAAAERRGALLQACLPGSRVVASAPSRIPDLGVQIDH